MRLLIKNIKHLVGTHESNDPLRGNALNQLPGIENGFLAIEDGVIAAYGPMSEWGGIEDWRNLEVIDAEGKIVMPTYCDSHTHIVYAGSREREFADRIAGLTYEEIAARGGGILNSAERLQKASEEELLESARTRLKEVINLGTGAIEIKSGYGLTVEAELKMLRVIKQLKEESPIPIKATFLGAHAYPKEYKENKAGYIELIINEMLPKIAEEGLADYVDAFCESNYFSVEDTVQILKAAKEYGLKGKVHVNQFNAIGGIRACAENGAISVDHLEVMDEDDFAVLAEHDMVATVLPSCSFFIKIPYAPVRKMLDKNAIVALATDYNPGSTPSGNMNFVGSLGCIQMNMTPEEVINASTLNGAYAMELNEEVGSINPGKKANFILTKEVPSLAFLPYSFGSDSIEEVYINGKPQRNQ